ncbi:hypothetical protein DFP93_12129 [Aneurinibacillus soli]|uniref:Uncharacterized protein n=1 Tax=Aneurinibacillus soli TaxID=1500254 RepID=A0A0U5C4J4_9BACL|nr:hypothetical protein [Aneurinibacillus soli]PYE58778.1 hypothetical protein DFP93_12129 [Aneurinibacillus soli]BAU26643.1 hypothetical protein CB4_00785 [Aneurinibacillus soli]
MEEWFLLLSADDIDTLLAFVSACIAAVLLFRYGSNSCKVSKTNTNFNKTPKLVKANINPNVIETYPVQPMNNILHTRCISIRSGDEEPLISFPV